MDEVTYQFKNSKIDRSYLISNKFKNFNCLDISHIEILCTKYTLDWNDDTL